MKNRTIIYSLAALLAVPLLAASGRAQAGVSAAAKEQIEAVQKAVKAAGAGWEAGETSVSGFSREEWKGLMGFDGGPSDAEPAPELSILELPAALDWRDNGGNYVTAPRDQKKCGSCWAFAMTGALESYALRTQNKPGQDLDLSEQVMLSCSGAGSCKGGLLNAGYLKKAGLPLEPVYPYTALDGSCSAAAPGWQGSAYKIVNYGKVSQKLATIKAALAAYGPLPTAMMVYEDFMQYKSGVYSYVTGKRLGGHAVLLVGYNDPGQYFIVKNSWNTGWGEQGFFRIAYSELDGKSNFGLSTIAYYTSKGDTAAQAAAWSRLAPRFEDLSWN
ncbi:MAG: C1 family peptidase [Elusimicrobiales bacterium]|nr:C1 family peptidase [Elusimicrobiales bacterium]